MLVPTRGRPNNARRLINACANTMTNLTTHITFIIDDNDPDYNFYMRVFTSPEFDTYTWFGFIEGPQQGLVGTLNANVLGMTKTYDAVGFMGDDHLPRTGGWDTRFVSELEQMKMGVVYGNDLIQGERLPTACAMTSNIPQTLGFMVPQTLRHLYADNFWLEIGRGLTGKGITYCPDVIIEHMHPIAQKATWDSGYEQVNSAGISMHDHEAFMAYMNTSYAADISKLITVKAGL